MPLVVLRGDRTTLGWQDRDYAKWTDDERRRYWGTSASRANGQGAVNGGKALAIGISVALSIIGAYALHSFPFGSHSPRTRPGIQNPSQNVLPPNTRVVCIERTIDPKTGLARCTRFEYVTTPSGTPT